MGDDISKRTIAVLLLITVVLSIAGTWSVVMGRLTSPPPAVQSFPTVAGAEVAFGIREVPQETARGEVRFGIREA